MKSISAALLLAFFSASADAAEPDSFNYSVVSPALEGKFPIGVESLKGLVRFGTLVANAKSGEIFDLWKNCKLKRHGAISQVRFPNAWIFITDDGETFGATVRAEWMFSPLPGVRRAEKAANIMPTPAEMPYFQAMQTFAREETGFHDIVALELIIGKYRTFGWRWGQERMAMVWTVRLRKGEREAQVEVRSFLSGPDEPGRSLGEQGLKIFELKDRPADDWSGVFRSEGGSGYP